MVNCGHTGRLGQFVEQVFNYFSYPGLQYFFFYSNRMQSNLISVWLSYLFMNLQNRVGCFPQSVSKAAREGVLAILCGGGSRRSWRQVKSQYPQENITPVSKCQRLCSAPQSSPWPPAPLGLVLLKLSCCGAESHGSCCQNLKALFLHAHCALHNQGRITSLPFLTTA